MPSTFVCSQVRTWRYLMHLSQSLFRSAPQSQQPDSKSGIGVGVACGTVDIVVVSEEF